MSKINSLLMPFEIGDLFFTTNNTNPSNRFGGTWELYAKGRTVVGIDPDDTDFNAIGKTGGSKDLQAHEHNVRGVESNTYEAVFVSNNATNAMTGSGSGYGLKVSYAKAISTGTGNSGNLQPYKVFAIWVRTA